MSDTLAYWWFRLRSALRWYAGASTRYDVHSPFLWAFVREVFADTRHYHAFDVIAATRKFWATQRRSKVAVQQLGAPSRTTSRTSRSASSLVADNAIGDREGRLLFRLALWTRARQLLEFGTNAGISSLYLHLADTRATLRTVEGNASIAALARTTFGLAPVSDRLHPYRSLFQDWLDDHLSDLPTQDLVFIDGDHRYQPTLDYVGQLLPKLTETSVVVVADIHWSAGMERAWK